LVKPIRLYQSLNYYQIITPSGSNKLINLLYEEM